MNAHERALSRLLDERNQRPERLAEIDARIRKRFAKKQAVMVLDMCGFSRLSLRYGVIHFLAMIRRMHHLVRPVVEAKGRVVKTDADNMLALFGDVPAAVKAAEQIVTVLADANRALPEDWDVHVGIGIGHGELLVVGGSDMFGEELNLAAKLGEDVAAAGEILLTEAASARIGPRRRQFQRRRVTLGRLKLICYGKPATGTAPAGSPTGR